jgi:hypothetical protein
MQHEQSDNGEHEAAGKSKKSHRRVVILVNPNSRL